MFKMLSENKTIELLKETKALLEGHFILSSGLRSEKYVQCAKLLMYPNKAGENELVALMVATPSLDKVLVCLFGLLDT